MRRTRIASLLATSATLGLLALQGASPAAAGVTAGPASGRSGKSAVASAGQARVNFHAWRSYQAFQAGAGDGVRVIPGSRSGVVISQPAGTMTYHDPFKRDTKNWAYSTWTTPVYRLGFGATELVSSWDAHVPRGTWMRTQLQATMQDGHKTRWLDMGNYAYLDTDIDRTSVSPVDKPYGQVETDTLPSLTDLEILVAHDIPVITSQAFDRGQITGADYSTAGHLWAVVGFTKAGNVVVNDPANPSDNTVRHVFNRRQFENVWLRTYWKRANGSTGYGTGGVAYIIWPRGMALPPNPDPANPAW